MERIKKIIFSFTLCIATIASSIVVLAATPSSVESKYNSLEDKNKSSVVVAGDKTSVTVGNITVDASASSGDGLAPVTIGGSTVYLSQESIDELDSALSSYVTAVESAKNDKSADGAKQRLSALEKAFDVNADIDNAANALKGFKDTIGILIGLLVYVVVIMFGLSSAIDIAYITIQPLRCFLDEKGELNTGRTADGQIKPKLISDEAIYAIRSATFENGKNPFGTYIIKRSFATIMLGIAIYMLLTGNFGLLMQFSLNVVSGIIDTLNKLAGA